jgi:hypothetical protein
MHECASVLRVNLWRKRGIVNKLAQGLWFEFTPSHNQTVLYPANLTFDPEKENVPQNEESIFLEKYVRHYGILLNEIKDKSYGTSVAMEHFNFSGAIANLSDIQVTAHLLMGF